MKDQILKLKSEKKQLLERVKIITTAIDALQAVCHHKHDDGKDALKSSGNTSHKECFTCEICGYEVWI
jgi:hypothetical protein